MDDINKVICISSYCFHCVNWKETLRVHYFLFVLHLRNPISLTAVYFPVNKDWYSDAFRPTYFFVNSSISERQTIGYSAIKYKWTSIISIWTWPKWPKTKNGSDVFRFFLFVCACVFPICLLSSYLTSYYVLLPALKMFFKLRGCHCHIRQGGK